MKKCSRQKRTLRMGTPTAFGGDDNDDNNMMPKLESHGNIQYFITSRATGEH